MVTWLLAILVILIIIHLPVQPRELLKWLGLLLICVIENHVHNPKALRAFAVLFDAIYVEGANLWLVF